MKKKFQRLTASVLSALMALQAVGISAFAEAEGSGISEFNFSTSRYVISEADGSYKITVNRRGDTSNEADVVFKAIDAIGTYGVDYLILDEDGNPLKKTDGTIIPIELPSSASAKSADTEEEAEELTEEPSAEPTAEPSAEPTAEPTEELTEEPSEEPTVEPMEELTEEPLEEPTAEPTAEPTVEPTEEPSAEPTAEPAEEPSAEPAAEPTAEPAEEPSAEPQGIALSEPEIDIDESAEPEKKAAAADISNIFSARNVMLGIEDGSGSASEQEQAKSEVKTALETLQGGILEAAGVTGVLHFKKGRDSAEITVKPIDNDRSGADRVILFALVGASSGSIAPNATAQLNIIDDEPYDVPVIEMAEANITLTEDAPSAEITVRRTTGLDHYVTVYASTYSQTAVKDEDFKPIEEKLIFAPGIKELTVTAEALAFEHSGSFGVRLESDGTCKIGENDRTVVRIDGSGAPERENAVHAAAQRARKAAALEAAEESAQLTAAPAAQAPAQTEVGSGIVGSPKIQPDCSVEYVYAHEPKIREGRNNYINGRNFAKTAPAAVGKEYNLACGDYLELSIPRKYIQGGKYDESTDWKKMASKVEVTLAYRYKPEEDQYKQDRQVSVLGDYFGYYSDTYPQLISTIGKGNVYEETVYNRKITNPYLYTEVNPRTSRTWYSDEWINYTLTLEDIPYIEGGGDLVVNIASGLIHKLDSYDLNKVKERYGYDLGNMDLRIDKVEVFYDEPITFTDKERLTLEISDGSYYHPSVFYVDYLDFESIAGVAERSVTGKPGKVTADFYDKDGWPVSKFYPGNDKLYVKWDTQAAKEMGVALRNLEVYDTFEIDGRNLAADGTYEASVDEILMDDYIGRDWLFGTAWDRPVVKLRLLSPDGGATKIKNNQPMESSSTYGEYISIRTGAKVRGVGQAGPGKVITGYAVYGSYFSTNNKRVEKELLMTYQNPVNPALLGSDDPNNAFYLPCPQGIYFDGYTWGKDIVIDIVPIIAYQDFTIKPHPSTANENLTWKDDLGQQYPVTYSKLAFLGHALTAGDDSTKGADENGEIHLTNVNGGSVYSITAMAPNGYITEWINGTMDEDGNGKIENNKAGTLSNDAALKLYTPFYGNTLTYQVNQPNPIYYYRFTQIEPSRLMDGQVRTGTVYRDNRTILTYSGTTPGETIPINYRSPVSNAVVTIGDRTVRADEKGWFSIKMDGLPNYGRASARVQAEDLNIDYVTYAVTNVDNNIEIPFYDTFRPLGASAFYEKSENQNLIASSGSKAGATLAMDDMLTISVRVNETSSENSSLYIKEAQFYISNGKTMPNDDEIIRSGLKEEEKKDKDIVANYSSKGNVGVATLTFNPSSKVRSGDRVYVQFVDQNGDVHRPMEVGYVFVSPMLVEDFVLGAIGSEFLATVVGGIEDLFLLGSPLIDMDMGEIAGMNRSVFTAGSEKRFATERPEDYEHIGLMYSYNWGFDYVSPWKDIGTKVLGGKSILDDSNPAKDNTDVDKDPGGDEKITRGKNDPIPDTPSIDKNNADIKEITDNTKLISQAQQENPSSKNVNPKAPKGSEVGNDNSKSTTMSSSYRFGIHPKVQFNLALTYRDTGEIDKDSKEKIYKNYFEELALAVALQFDASFVIEIAFPVGISLMIRPSLGGTVEGVYLMKTNYDGDPYWNNRMVEYSAKTFGLFKDFDDGYGRKSVLRTGYIGLSPYISLGLGVKVLIFEVGGTAQMDFNMDFAFGDTDTRTYGDISGTASVNVYVLNFNVYSTGWNLGSKKMFGTDDEPIDPSSLYGYSPQRRMARAMQDMFTGEAADTTVRAMDRSYLDDAGGWNGGATKLRRMARAVEDGDEPVDKIVAEGVMPGGDMVSARLDGGKMLAVYVGDPGRDKRADNDRSCIYYTVRDTDGSWSSSKPFEDDGTMDKEPVIYDLGDKLFVTWLTASEEFADSGESEAVVASALNSLDIHGVFVNKESGEPEGEVFTVTNDAEAKYSDGNIAITRLDENSGNMRVYYTKTRYNEGLENIEELLSVESVIVYRDYKNGEWDTEYTLEEKDAIARSGADPEAFSDLWYGQRFVDSRIGNRFPLITDVEADYRSGAWSYFAFIGDDDGNVNTINDRRVYLLFDNDEMNGKPVCVTPDAGYYDDLQFCYSANGQLMLMFKSNQIPSISEDGEAITCSGAAYVDLSEVFEKQSYEWVWNEEGSYWEVYAADENGAPTSVLYRPETAIEMDQTMQRYQLMTDEGGRMYVLWTENTLNDDGTSGLQIYASVFNGKNGMLMDDFEGEGGGESPAEGIETPVWSTPYLVTSPLEGSYSNFTAQAMDGRLHLLAKRTSADNVSQLAYHAVTPAGGLTYEDNLAPGKYVYADRVNDFEVAITNTGAKAMKTQWNDSDGTWKDAKGDYRISMDIYRGDQLIKPLAVEEESFAWHVGASSFIRGVWQPTENETAEDIMAELEKGNLDLVVTVSQDEEEISSLRRPIYTRPDLAFENIQLEQTQGSNAMLSFNLVNSGNLTANPTVSIMALGEGNEAVPVARIDIEELQPNSSTSQTTEIAIPEELLEMDGAAGKYILTLDAIDGKLEEPYSTSTSGTINYDSYATELVSGITDLTVEQSSLSLRAGNAAKLEGKISPAEATKKNRIKWVSSDESVAVVADDGTVTAINPGEATITAYAIPSMLRSVIQPNGDTITMDMQDMIPERLVRSQTVKVTVSGGGSTGGSGGSSSYTVMLDTQSGLAASRVSVNKDGTLERPEDPTREGYTFGGWYTDKECTQEYDFNSKVTKALTLYAKWIENTEQPDTWNNPFTDVKPGSWFYDNVRYAFENKLFAGVTDSEFAPNSPMTRAMLVTVLYRAEGEPDIENEIWGYPFADVDAESWYGTAVYWARMNGIVKGYSDEEFAPDQEISREQIAAILQRYADFKGRTTDEKDDLSAFTDAAQISDWARGNVEWAVGTGLISGRGEGILDPIGLATRAEVAAMLHRFLEK